MFFGQISLSKLFLLSEIVLGVDVVCIRMGGCAESCCN